MKAYVMCGPIGSGKTYVAETLYGHIPHFNPDKLMPEDEEWTREASNAAWDEIHRKIKDFSSISLEFVIDSSQALQLSRRRLTQYIRQVAPSYEIICIFVKTPYSQCRERNAERDRNVPESQLKEYFDTVMRNPPSRADGYDRIVVVDNCEYQGNIDKLWSTKESWPEKWYYA